MLPLGAEVQPSLDAEVPPGRDPFDRKCVRVTRGVPDEAVPAPGRVRSSLRNGCGPRRTSGRIVTGRGRYSKSVTA